jgi:hypothetical protein
MVTTYSQFIGMKPPTFTKAEEPLDADAWVRAIEAKFSAFVLLVLRSTRLDLQPCSFVVKLYCGGSTLRQCNLVDMKLLGRNSRELSRTTTSQKDSWLEK